jgi:hypothetical protein
MLAVPTGRMYICMSQGGFPYFYSLHNLLKMLFSMFSIKFEANPRSRSYISHVLLNRFNIKLQGGGVSRVSGLAFKDLW